MKLNKLLIGTITVLVLSACSSGSTKEVVDKNNQPKMVVQTVDGIPDWYLEPHGSDANYIYVVGTGSSSDLALSIEKAILDAQNSIAGKITTEVSSLMNQFKQDTGYAVRERTEQFVRKLVAEVNVSSSEITNKKLVAINGNYITYVQVRYPINELRLQIDDRKSGNSRDSIQIELDARLANDKAGRNATNSRYKYVTPTVPIVESAPLDQ